MCERSERDQLVEAFWSTVTVVLAVLAVLLLGHLAEAHAGCKQVAVVQTAVQTQFIAVPVATPLGLPVYAQPVAQAGLVAYGPAGATARSETVSREAKSVDSPVPPSPDGKPYELYLREFQAYLAVRGGVIPQATGQQTVQAAAAQPEQTLVQQHCTSCHNPTKKDGGLDLTGELTPTIRLKSVFRLTNDTAEKPAMPKGKLLTNDQRGELVRELTGNP